METHTYIPSYKEMNADIAKLQAEFAHAGKSVQLNIRLLAAGHYKNASPQAYNHPEPIFNRIFVFKKNTADIKTKYEHLKLKPGNIYLLPAGLPFQVKYNSCDFIFWHLRIEDYLGISVFSRPQKILSISDKPLHKNICETHDSHDMLKLLGQIFQATSVFIGPLLGSIISRYDNTEKFAPIFNYLQNSQPAKVQLDTLAEIMKMSRAALSKSFARKTGISIKTYLQNYQLQKAREMLLFSDMPIHQIAQKLGHSSSQYFHRMFRKHTGMTPKQYREMATMN